MICGRSPARTRSLVAGHSRICRRVPSHPPSTHQATPLRGIVRPPAARAAQDRDPTVAVDQYRETFEIVSRRRCDRRGRQQPLDLRRQCVARDQQRLHFFQGRSKLASGHGVHPQVTRTSPAYHDPARLPAFCRTFRTRPAPMATVSGNRPELLRVTGSIAPLRSEPYPSGCGR